MNILIVNQPVNNRGDESAHRAFMGRLKIIRPQDTITVLFIDKTSEEIDAMKVDGVRYVNVPMNISSKRFEQIFIKAVMMTKFFLVWHFHSSIHHINKYLKDSDIVICAPGGICMGGFMNWRHIAQLYMAKIAEKPIFYFGRSFGPFSNETFKSRQFKKRSISLLRYFSFLSIRDATTQQLAKSLNIDFTPTIDSAFLETPNVELPSEITDILGSTPYIVFVPNSLSWHYAYLHINKDVIDDFWVKLISYFQQIYKNTNIVMLPQTYGKVKNQGYDYFMEIKRKVGGTDSIIVLDDKYGSNIQQTIISNAMVTIGARYHSIVFAINQNCPFISLSYEHKMTGLLELLGKKDCEIDILHIFDNADEQEKAISKIDLLLKRVKRDVEARQKAIQIANEGLEKFAERLSNI